jgi:hypothetical protein
MRKIKEEFEQKKIHVIPGLFRFIYLQKYAAA